MYLVRVQSLNLAVSTNINACGVILSCVTLKDPLYTCLSILKHFICFYIGMQNLRKMHATHQTLRLIRVKKLCYIYIYICVYIYTHTHTHTHMLLVEGLRSSKKFPRASWSYQFSSVAQQCMTLCNPMDYSTPGLPVHHQLPEFT